MAENLKAFRRPNTSSSEYNAQDFIIWQKILQINTCELVKVIEVNADKTVDVKPLLNSLSGNETAVESGIAYNIPYGRQQAGTNALLLTPEKGDIGLCAYCQRDISGIKVTKAQSNPLSARAYDISDGIYVCSIVSLNQEPSRFVELNSSGITIEANGELVINTSQATVNGNLQVNGQINASGDITAAGISLDHHIHPGVTPGEGTTGEPK